ncbi:UDP-N-acetylmuramoyl-L-alanyl-D-glutamate--2,6-diaminopimelate ligase [Sandaracinus amylolyticus]|uniref:UDP-N-acetylmuramoyl-L-alanyl-D-glutamate--2, 6-diaminopimelate ligase n=1 Tax=Sandaracinus amylolyticus TaxID=927083 RepID=UPI001EFFE2A9|nr:UDP-N-acetylmuramoyl-L-alanyl-D-glutamate--2,6-diaminopimelate ligase [Sandaracinus amylolyticus]UJR80112.1 UDP-N-acetylmuramoyl-L-alanyl-D-glutamate--2, 6-diaminopimelate ligase [Sandaracinus amylolyticus]
MSTLGELQRALGAELHGDASIVARGVRHDSRAIEAGDVFVAIAGQKARGTEFAAGAIARGAVAVITEEWIELEAPQIRVSDARRALAIASHHVYGDPTASLACIGVTGTNGKTTTTWLIDEALTALAQRPALLGTVETRGPGFREQSAFTTPEADAIARFARRMVDARATHLVMEVSSHALALHRADGIHFEVAAFTNLTQDHLDFHGSMEAYFEAKARLFTELAPRHAVVRIDDPMGAELAARITGPTKVHTLSRHRDATIRATNVAIDRDGVRCDASTPWGSLRIESALLGAHNLDNLLVAAGCLLAAGLAPSDVSRALRAAKGAPGRLERVEDPRDVAVLVDYAHSPDALANVLDALRPLTPGRLVCVFGCGGDRDRGKRPKMGEAAATRADVVVITSDNPRTEDPRAIVDMIVPGVAALPAIALDALASSSRGHVVEVDRRRAIDLALAAARSGDTVLIAGKGHEDYQILGTTKIDFDDRVEARRAIARALEAGGAR